MNLEKKAIYEVHEFTRIVKNILESEDLKNVCIKGEISNYKRHTSGHIYFTLKDKESQLQCVMFKQDTGTLYFEPKSGMKIIVYGDINVYEKRGQYQLIIHKIKPDGIGELYKLFDELKKKLESEGLFSPKYKKSIPKYPQTIGIATSDAGAVLHDIINVLKRRFPVKVMFCPTAVQGEKAAECIVRSIKTLDKTNVDVIILGRGGGSIEDLWAFNDENVARAIFESKTPIISAVGHETDTTISDLVADVRAPTPSVAAEISVPDKKELHNNLNILNRRLKMSMNGIINEKKSMVLNLKKRAAPSILINKISEYRKHINDINKRQKRCIFRIFENKKNLLKSNAGKLDSVSPLSILSRGYNISLKIEDNKPINSIYDIEKDDVIQIIFIDGKIYCKVKEKVMKPIKDIHVRRKY